MFFISLSFGKLLGIFDLTEYVIFPSLFCDRPGALCENINPKINSGLTALITCKFFVYLLRLLNLQYAMVKTTCPILELLRELISATPVLGNKSNRNEEIPPGIVFTEFDQGQIYDDLHGLKIIIDKPVHSIDTIYYHVEKG